MAGRHDLRLHIPDDPVWIRADLARLTQVVTNLLHNSVTCTPPGGRIELDAGREGDRAVIRVRDNGIGIPPQALPGLFEMFRQVKRAETGGRLVFVEDYEMNLARYLVQGVDVWMNTPRRPYEASGTSGMKAALNGALNFSVLDGWWREAYNGYNGWAIGAGRQFLAK